MKAVILVGGLGTRLQPLTFSFPKPLLPVGERPILQIILEQLRDAGFTEAILATGYQAELIQTFCGDGSKFGLRVHYVKEEQMLGTAGPLSLVREHIGKDDFFLLMNGDILTKMDFRDFLQTGRRKNWDLTVAYTKHVYQSPFGVLTIESDQIRGIVEKPSHESLISAGMYCVKSTTLAHVPDGTFFTVPDLIRTLIAAGKTVGAYFVRECWIGLETIVHFEEALKELHNAPSVEPAAPVKR
jgi:NDP-sugar pyrophosphorylase family protein